MCRLALNRLAQAVPVLIGLSLVSFLLIHLVPGDPVRAAVGFTVPDETVATVRAELGLDKPLPQQYVDFMAGAARLDFGYSVNERQEVVDVIGPAIAPSALLIAYAMVLALAIAIPLAIAAALREGRLIDHVVRLAAMTGLSIPQFWLGLLLVLTFSVSWSVLPIAGYGTNLPDHLYHLSLPALTIALTIAPILMSALRAGIVEGLRSGYVEAARARGLSARRIVIAHVLRNSCVSLITIAGVLVGLLVSGTVVVENVFGIPGLGRQIIDAVTARDYTVVQALTLLLGVFVIVTNVITDMLYGLVDPRVRL